MTGPVAGALAQVERRIRSYGTDRAAVAFSGGVDSSVVLAAATLTLGAAHVSAFTALSPSYPSGELDAARSVAASIGVAHRTIETREVEKEAYARNDAMRCFHCKTELYASLARIAASAGSETVVLAGANADDLGDLRPGLWAGEQHDIRNPLLEEGIGKPMVRAIARNLGLAVAEKPALACLSSRVAYGIRITPRLLRRIDAAERAVRALGFETVRVRHLGDTARIEVAADDVPGLLSDPRLHDLAGYLRALGWSDVSVDPEGYRTGSMNASPPPAAGLAARTRTSGGRGRPPAPPARSRARASRRA